MRPLEQNEMKGEDAELILQEYRLAARMLKHAARRGLWSLNASGSGASGRRSGAVESLRQDMEEIIQEYRSVWLARNRPGGLEDSAQRLNRALEDYR